MGRANARLIETFVYACTIPVAVAFGFLRFFYSDKLRDFGSFYASGEAAANGLNPYAIYPLTYAVTTPTFCGYDQNLNPPTMLPLLEALSRLPPVAAFRLWTVISIASAVAIFALLKRTYPDQIDMRAVLWFLALGAIWDTLYLGQLYIPLALIACAAWVLLRENREIAAGVLIGALIALKPNFAVWPALLLFAGYYRTVSAAGATGLAIVLGSLVLYGPTVYEQWLHLLGTDGARAVMPINGSLIGLFARLGAESLGQALAIALLIASAAWAWKTRPPVLVISGVALAVSLLASPIAWAHYSLFLVPIIFAYWKERGPIAWLSTWILIVPPTFAGAASIDSWLALITVGTMYTVAFAGVASIALGVSTTQRSLATAR